MSSRVSRNHSNKVSNSKKKRRDEGHDDHDLHNNSDSGDATVGSSSSDGGEYGKSARNSKSSHLSFNPLYPASNGLFSKLDSVGSLAGEAGDYEEPKDDGFQIAPLRVRGRLMDPPKDEEWDSTPEDKVVYASNGSSRGSGSLTVRQSTGSGRTRLAEIFVDEDDDERSGESEEEEEEEDPDKTPTGRMPFMPSRFRASAARQRPNISVRKSRKPESMRALPMTEQTLFRTANTSFENTSRLSVPPPFPPTFTSQGQRSRPTSELLQLASQISLPTSIKGTEFLSGNSIRPPSHLKSINRHADPADPAVLALLNDDPNTYLFQKGPSYLDAKSRPSSITNYDRAIHGPTTDWFITLRGNVSYCRDRESFLTYTPIEYDFVNGIKVVGVGSIRIVVAADREFKDFKMVEIEYCLHIPQAICNVYQLDVKPNRGDYITLGGKDGLQYSREVVINARGSGDPLMKDNEEMKGDTEIRKWVWGANCVFADAWKMSLENDIVGRGPLKEMMRMGKMPPRELFVGLFLEEEEVADLYGVCPAKNRRYDLRPPKVLVRQRFPFWIEVPLPLYHEDAPVLGEEDDD